MVSSVNLDVGLAVGFLKLGNRIETCNLLVGQFESY